MGLIYILFATVLNTVKGYGSIFIDKQVVPLPILGSGVHLHIGCSLALGTAHPLQRQLGTVL